MGWGAAAGGEKGGFVRMDFPKEKPVKAAKDNGGDGCEERKRNDGKRAAEVFLLKNEIKQ